MAPTTRLRDKPSLRVNYGTPKRGTREHPLVITDEGSHANPFVIPDSPKTKPAARPSGPLTRSAGITKVKAPVKTLNLKRKLDCGICAYSRSTTLFPAEKGVKVCKHLETVCMYCVEKLVKGMVDARKLGEAVLPCLDPACEHVLSFENVKTIVRNDAFETWDAAMAQHHLRVSDQYIACLNVDCGHHFSIEYCNKETSRKKKIACPYCEYELCIDCNRPWHAKTGCSKNKTAENEESEAAIKKLGAKPCPKCGVNIDKISGCDHMTCNQCGHHFCWQCFVTYNSIMRHAEGCAHGRQNIAQEPGNFYNGPIDGLANFEGVIFRGLVPAPAPAADAAAQAHVPRDPLDPLLLPPNPILHFPQFPLPRGPLPQALHMLAIQQDALRDQLAHRVAVPALIGNRNIPDFPDPRAPNHPRGVNVWGLNNAIQEMHMQVQGLLRRRVPDYAAPARQDNDAINPPTRQDNDAIIPERGQDDPAPHPRERRMH